MKIVFFLLLHTIVMDTFAQQLQPIPSGAFHWADLPVRKNNQREGRKIAEGTTAEFEYFEMHTTVQEKGAVPSAVHTQQDIEELIIVTEGKMKCTIGNKSGIIGAGGILFIPPLESQAFENIGDGPLKYYVFMFRSKKPMNIERSNKAGGTMLLNADSLEFKKTEIGGTVKYFDRPSAMTENFEMHITQLYHKGPSHAPHQHVDTEAILILEGNTTMTIDGVNYTAGPGDLYIMGSGTLHGISNAEEKPCRYFAFKWR
ncbi:MAG: cupin domain-containing protein [Chitinophagaceae bacterium]